MFSRFYSSKGNGQGNTGYSEGQPVEQSNELQTSAHDFGLVRPSDPRPGATRLRPGTNPTSHTEHPFYPEGMLVLSDQAL